MILMNPLVQIAVVIFLAGVVALLALIFTDHQKGIGKWIQKWGFIFGDEDEDEPCPDWADPVKWRDSQ